MKKIVLLAAVAAMLVGMLAGPAAAHGPVDVGVFTGTAAVGKGNVCDADPLNDGAGLGVPVVHGVKTGTWSLQTTVTTARHSVAALSACGKLGPVLSNVFPVGAACGMSKGYDGSGTLSGVGTVSGLGWKLTVGGMLPVIGTISHSGVSGTLLAVVQAQGGLPCASKSGSGAGKSGGATSFAVAGVTVAVDAGPLSWNNVICKGAAPCLYGAK